MKTTTWLTSLAVVLAMTACGTAADLEGEGGDEAPQRLVIGSQDYYSNEILAEVYAQALEAAGHPVDRQLRIGQREVYIPDLQVGRIDVFPEYSGNLLQHHIPGTTARLPQDVATELAVALPEGLRALEFAPATDQDSYVVTKEFAEQHGLSSIADLADVDGVVLGGNSELETRPYGPKGLAELYGVEVTFTPVEDSGGALTVKALRSGTVNLVDIYSADPVLTDPDLVVLEDPKGLFLTSNVVPVVSDKVDAKAEAVLNKVSAAMSPEDLRGMNQRSVTDQAPAATIAADWLKSEGLA
ncbi:ABC transporter substrate-binding protein [Arachnia propionica]|uniref:ABC transporter substrate-binding protein n=1 Tax=Arachnia propionica TaxID=1750 RepID=A0A3P1T9Y9_9ACTN|nr:ABC transporter substrate-binding protein [Arachnia propionica]RRD06254.1 ABC transporter substrate-binding protein [Arachnia propionica]